MKPTFEEFRSKVFIMRTTQKAYYAADKFSPEKRELLDEARDYEKQVDRMLAELAEPQESLL